MPTFEAVLEETYHRLVRSCQDPGLMYDRRGSQIYVKEGEDEHDVNRAVTTMVERLRRVASPANEVIVHRDRVGNRQAIRITLRYLGRRPRVDQQPRPVPRRGTHKTSAK